MCKLSRIECAGHDSVQVKFDSKDKCVMISFRKKFVARVMIDSFSGVAWGIYF